MELSLCKAVGYNHNLPFEANLYTDPLNPDTDGDNVTDGKEINGYDLVWMETLPGGSVKHHKLRHVTSDPLDPTNGMRDTDGDGMPQSAVLASLGQNLIS